MSDRLPRCRRRPRRRRRFLLLRCRYRLRCCLLPPYPLQHPAPFALGAPSTGRTIAKNSLRPHVAAANRIYAWRTPYAERNRAELEAELPGSLAAQTLLAVRGGLAQSSASTYAAGPLRFTQFCDTHGISEEARMPASTASSAPLSASTSRRLEVARSAHGFRVCGPGICTTTLRGWGDHYWVKQVRVAADKQGVVHKRPPRVPVSIDHLLALQRALCMSNPMHTAIWAVALVTFFGCRRLGETLVNTVANFDPAFHVTKDAAPQFRTHRGGSRSVSFRIPWTKTTHELGAAVIVTGRDDRLDPCAAMQRHLEVNAAVPSSAPLFAYATG